MNQRETQELIEEKRRKMETAGAMTWQQQEIALKRIGDISLNWKKPDPDKRPANWVCPRCDQIQHMGETITGKWNPYTNRAIGRDYCNDCVEADRQAFNAQMERDKQINKWKLNDGTHQHMRLYTYTPSNKSQQEALQAAKMLTDVWKDGIVAGGFWLHSRQFGVGKTHLAYSILWVAANLGFSVAVWDEVTLLAKIKATYGENNGKSWSEDSLLTEMATAKVVAWDDMGRAHVRTQSLPWYQAIVYNVLNARYDAQLPTIITSNLTPNDLRDRIGGASYSRLRGLAPIPIQLIGNDYRMRSGE